jgi:hypothetical protein
LATAYGIQPGQGTFVRNAFTIHFTAPNLYDIEADLNAASRLYTLKLMIFNTSVPISSITLQMAFVQVGIGEQTNRNG